ncbi:carboxypeptidase B-like [Topomyia yanbarensis]|uniref:carboxypeptidase B-like n=1 Tax=Topomyia yanbarensis TaxID=2498891 RepID=UPI00273BAB83|nr:carboxypeptidase B-like [Topomyia yanbarensis]
MRSLVLVLCFVVLVVGKTNPRHTISWDHFWTQEEIEEYMHELVEHYPDIATLETIGTSTEGRDIDAILVSYGTNANKPLVVIDAGLRAREWVSPMMAMFVLHELVEHPEQFSDILAEVNFLVIPLVNPDGYVYSHETDRNWIKSRSDNGNGCYGVDLNRNFDYQWGTVGVSSDPCADNFAGSAALSEPETQAIRDTVSRYATNLKLYLSVQAASKKVLYPFSYNGQRTPSNAAEHSTVAQMVARTMMGQHGYIYTYGPAGMLLPVESGTVTDFVSGTYTPQYTFVLETRGGTDNEYELPEDKLSEVLYETAAGLKVLGEYVAGIRSV